MSNYLLTALISIPQEAGYFFPNRHFEYISGGPLFSVMIAKLEAIPQVGKIIVNSDSGRIKSQYSRQDKVKVIDVYRAEPQEIELELTSDRATAALLEHAEGEHFLQLGPIFPFLKHQTIDSVIEAYDKYVLNPEDHRNDSIFTIRTLNRRYYDSDTDFIREDRPNTFVEDGILHVFNRTTFLAGGMRKVGKKPFAWGIDEIENLAIDSEENYRLGVLIDENRRRFPSIFGR
jgi:CMP-N-acetylneuraminic acid synthetase